MRSSASAGLFGAGNGLASAPPATLRRRAARSSSSVRAALRAVTGSETTDQRNRLGSFLSASAVNTCVPSGRSLGAMVIGTSNCGLKFSRTYSLESLRLTNTAIWPGRLGGSALAAFSAPGSRAASFFTSGATAGAAGASATALTGSAGFSAALDSAGLDLGVLASSTFGVPWQAPPWQSLPWEPRCSPRRISLPRWLRPSPRRACLVIRRDCAGFGRFDVRCRGFGRRLGFRRVRLCFRIRRIAGRLNPGCRRRCIGHGHDGVDRRQRAAGIRGVGLFAQRSRVTDSRSEIQARLRIAQDWHSQTWSHGLRPRPCRSSPRGRRSPDRWR